VVDYSLSKHLGVAMLCSKPTITTLPLMIVLKFMAVMKKQDNISILASTGCIGCDGGYGGSFKMKCDRPSREIEIL
jgi:hypothetical protein